MEACHLDKFIQQIKDILLEFDDFKVSHSFYDENRVVDMLANMGGNVAMDSQIEIFEDLLHL